MEITQIYELTNMAVREVLGETAVLNEDLSNVVDIGTAIFNANAVDNYVRALVNRIGKTIFVSRKYTGRAPSVLVDSWEFGSILMKVRAGLPEAEENESWNLRDRASYDPNIFYQPEISAKFFNKRITFEIPRSIAEKQVKESFQNAGQLNAFISMIYNMVDKALTVRMDSLIMDNIANMIGETIYNETQGGAQTGRTGNKAANLLYEYNQQYGKSLQASKAITDPEFIRFATWRIGVYKDRLATMSKLFNIGKTDKFTPADMLKTVLLSDFAEASKTFLRANTHNAEMVALPTHEAVSYWQGPGTDYNFQSVSKINIKTATGHNITVNGILGVMFDRDAVVVSNEDRRVTTNYNAKAEFFTNFYKFDCGYINDLDENFVVFYVA